jgi:hypothetical protein
MIQRYNPDHRGHFSSLMKILISSSGESANFLFAHSTSPPPLEFLRRDFRRSTSPPSRILDFPSTLYTENSRSKSRISPTIFFRIWQVFGSNSKFSAFHKCISLFDTYEGKISWIGKYFHTLFILFPHIGMPIRTNYIVPAGIKRKFFN